MCSKMDAIAMPYQTAVNQQSSRILLYRRQLNGKTIVVEISEGRQRPYYIKALVARRDGGVYVRVAGTTALLTSIW